MESQISSLSRQSENEIKKHKSSKYIFLQSFCALLGAFYYGYALGELNMALSKIMIAYDLHETDLQDLYEGILTSAMPLGGTFGCIIAGILMKNRGRRSLMILSDIIGIIIGFLFIIPNFYIGVISRFIMGLIVGSNSTIGPLYVREISPVSLSAQTGIMNQGNVSFGILVGYLLGLQFPMSNDEEEQNRLLEEQSDIHWRIVLFFPSFICFIRLMTMILIFRYDTPQYYMLQGKESIARKYIEKIYKQEYVENIMSILHSETKQKQKQNDSWGLVFSKYYRSRLFLASSMQFLYQFCGINAIIFYSSSIFEDSIGDKKMANFMTIISGIILMVFSFLASFTSKKYGRKTILMYGNIGLLVFLLATGICSQITSNYDEINTVWATIIIGLIFIYEIIFSFSLGTMVWVYNAEILNSEKALGFATMISWISAFVIGLLVPYLSSQLGIYSLFYFFAFICLLGFIYIGIYGKETKDLTQEEIVLLFVSQQQNNEIGYKEMNIKNVNNINCEDQKQKDLDGIIKSKKQNQNKNNDQKNGVENLDNQTKKIPNENNILKEQKN